MKKSLLIFSVIMVFQGYSQTDSPDFYINYCKNQKKHPIPLFRPNYKKTNDLLNLYDVHFYFLNLNVSNTSTHVMGNVTIEAKVIFPVLDTFCFELNPELSIDSILLNSELCNFTRDSYFTYVIPQTNLVAGTLFNVNIYYNGEPKPKPLSGIFTSYSETYNVHVTWTLSEPFSASDWWPTKQVLQDKADSVWVFITTDSSCMAGSQGILTNVIPLQNGYIRYEWKSNYPIEYYLISIAVSDYQEYNLYAKPQSLINDSVFIQNFIYNRPGCLGTYQPGINNTVAFLELFSDLYSIYPFYNEKYGHCLTEIGGGMEHQTMTTIGNFNYGIVAHELAHMWWGNYVTCATWSDIWINEGFATYSDYLAHEFLAGGDYPQIWLKQVHEEVLSEPGGSVYIPAHIIANEDSASVKRIFDVRLSYLKGASIIHMLRWELQNDDLFFAALRSFLSYYADSVATGNDFLHHFNTVTLKNFDYFFNQWFYGEGYPIYDVNWAWDNGLFSLKSYQSQSSSTSFFNMLLQFKLIHTDSTFTLISIRQQDVLSELNTLIPLEVIGIEMDPYNNTLEKVNTITHNVSNSNFNNFLFSPNPFKSKFSVHPNFIFNQPLFYYIFNNNGTLIKTGELNNNNRTVDLSAYSNGLYHIRLLYKGASVFHKMLKY